METRKLTLDDLKIGQTYHNGKERRRTVVAINGIFVYYITKRKSQITGVWISDFLKWAKGVVE